MEIDDRIPRKRSALAVQTFATATRQQDPGELLDGWYKGGLAALFGPWEILRQLAHSYVSVASQAAVEIQKSQAQFLLREFSDQPTQVQISPARGAIQARRSGEGLGDALAAHKLAIKQVYGEKVSESLNHSQKQGSGIWRLSLHLSPLELSDTSKIVRNEEQIHDIVYNLSPKSLGYFSIRYASDDGNP